MTRSWEDKPGTFCDCEIDDCEKLHPATQILPDRFAYWEIGHQAESYYAAAQIEDFRTEVEFLFNGESATVKDMLTGESMDAAEFLAQG